LPVVTVDEIDAGGLDPDQGLARLGLGHRDLFPDHRLLPPGRVHADCFHLWPSLRRPERAGSSSTRPLLIRAWVTARTDSGRDPERISNSCSAIGKDPFGSHW